MYRTSIILDLYIIASKQGLSGFGLVQFWLIIFALMVIYACVRHPGKITKEYLTVVKKL